MVGELRDMSQQCDTCGEMTERYILRLSSGKFYTECKVCDQPRHSAPSCVNPYADLTLEHVTGEDGKPVRVTSKRQLLEAEKRYNFRSLVAHTYEANFDKPPQDKLANLHPADRIAAQMNEQSGRRDARGNKLGFLFPEQANAMLREMKEKNINIDSL